MRRIEYGLAFAVSCGLLLSGCEKGAPPAAALRHPVYLGQGMMAGEVTENSVILQARLTSTRGVKPLDGDVSGTLGVARFLLTTDPESEEVLETEWLEATRENDFIVKAKVAGLEPNTRYYYRAVYGPDREMTEFGPTGTFKTLGGKDAEGEVSFVVVTGMNYGKFYYGRLGTPVRTLCGMPGVFYVHSGEWRTEEDIYGPVIGSSSGQNAYLVCSDRHPDDFEIKISGTLLEGNEFTFWFAGSPQRTERDGYTLAIGDYGAKFQRKGKDVLKTDEVRLKEGESINLIVRRKGGRIHCHRLVHREESVGEELLVEWEDPEPLKGEGHHTMGFYVYDGTIEVWVLDFDMPAVPGLVIPPELTSKGLFYQGAYQGEDKELGFPAAEAILKMKPDFFVGTGDNVYYDSPRSAAARTKKELRKKWHEQFAQPRLRMLFTRVPTYWEKDDHDHRFDDCDNEGDKPPSSELGIRTFIEQVPVVDPKDPNPITYRTHCINKHLQIWLVEGRDYRSPNDMEDGPGKTLWGKEQMAWLKRTLLESDATFKLLISPTPLIGPDRATKRDNHCNIGGFQHERDEFFKWLGENGFLEKNFYIICGDRHWQYHAVHPSGFEEFSCGAMVDANTARAELAGGPKTTDPEGLIEQHYIQTERSGGFLRVILSMGRRGRGPVTLGFNFYDENGEPLYSTAKSAK